MSTVRKKFWGGRIAALAAISIGVVTIAMGGFFQVSRARGAGAPAWPKVTSVAQVTHDGLRKAGLVADDSEAFVTELLGPRRTVAKVTFPGQERLLVSNVFEDMQALDVSPDRTKLLLARRKSEFEDDEFWTMPVNGGAPERVGSLTGRDAAWSPDGQSIVFGQGPAVTVADAAGTKVRAVFTSDGSVISPSFSPDGQRIRFTLSDLDHGTTSLWEVGRDGSNAHALLPNWEQANNACCGRWTADGRYYIFQTTQNVTGTATVVTRLWALPDAASTVDATTPLPLTDGPMSFGNVVPVRDSKTAWAIGVKPAVEVVKYDFDKKKYVPVAGGISATDLEYSPDGAWVTYVAIPDATLWRSRSDGKDKLQLTFSPDRAALPHWSPDGKQIAYVSMRAGEPWRIRLISANGGKAEEMLHENRPQVDASWSPDGGRILFGSTHWESQLKIRIVDLKTRQIEEVPGSEGLFSPRWSPDGRYIAALSPDYTTLRLYDFETHQWSDWLKEPAGAVSYPAWSADSKSICFDDLVTGEETIRRLKIGENHAEDALIVRGVEHYPGPLGPWSGMAADGSAMFVQDRSTQEIYRLNVELP